MASNNEARRFRVRRHALGSGIVSPWCVADLERPAYVRREPTHAAALAVIDEQLEREARQRVEARELDALAMLAGAIKAGTDYESALVRVETIHAETAHALERLRVDALATLADARYSLDEAWWIEAQERMVDGIEHDEATA